MGQRVNLCRFARVGVDLVETGQSVSSVDVHRTRAADTCRYETQRAFQLGGGGDWLMVLWKASGRFPLSVWREEAAAEIRFDL